MGLKLPIYILGLKFLIYILGLKFLIYIYGLEISNSNSQVAGWEQFIQYWETWETVLLWEVSTDQLTKRNRKFISFYTKSWQREM